MGETLGNVCQRSQIASVYCRWKLVDSKRSPLQRPGERELPRRLSKGGEGAEHDQRQDFLHETGWKWVASEHLCCPASRKGV